ncbi:hypothetical protein PCANC_12396 [Puccinia coronata f. sp. avenae]|uniref:Uncharacterized protein n=1 Tax=Puccinia coronata f. sp. avenae TaxID=200324 RepID=A0A2N5VB57_9BASI|nr:hypothetical protein PCANC_12396 [Puccinia coronata f. sp. avenae]
MGTQPLTADLLVRLSDADPGGEGDFSRKSLPAGGCQNTQTCTSDAADTFMHAINDALRSDKQGSVNQGTALGP